MPDETSLRSGEGAGPLESEARLLTRYLLGVDPPLELVHRYRQGHDILFPEPYAPVDQEIVSWVHRHPATLPLLDAAMAVLRPTGLLRGKLVAMAAILEATPEFADHFAPQAPGTIRAILSLLRSGTRAAFCLIGGILLYFLIVRPTAGLRPRG